MTSRRQDSEPHLRRVADVGAGPRQNQISPLNANSTRPTRTAAIALRQGMFLRRVARNAIKTDRIGVRKRTIMG
jgi:hypothetical protein